MKLIRTIAVLLTMTLLLTPCAGIAESLPLTEEQVAFYRARTEEWEAAYGPCVVWDYQTRAAFSKIYHRFPGDYINRMDPDHPALPVLPENVAVSYEEAVDIAYAALTDYSDRITADYLDGLTLASHYMNLVQNEADKELIEPDFWQMWAIQFFEELPGGEETYVMRCGVQLNAQTGKVVTMTYALDAANDADYDNISVITF